MTAVLKPKAEESLKKDSLLETVVLLTKMKGDPLTSETLRAGIPLEDNLFTPKLMVRALKRERYNAKIVTKRLQDFSHIIIPVVLILKQGQCCVLKKSLAHGKYLVVFADELDCEKVISHEKFIKSLLWSGLISTAQVSVSR